MQAVLIKSNWESQKWSLRLRRDHGRYFAILAKKKKTDQGWDNVQRPGGAHVHFDEATRSLTVKPHNFEMVYLFLNESGSKLHGVIEGENITFSLEEEITLPPQDKVNWVYYDFDIID